MGRLHGSDEESERLRSLRNNVIAMGSAAKGRESFARRYLRYLEDQGYELPDVPELEPLVRSAHAVRFMADGYSFTVVAIFDRDRDPDARLSIGADELRQIARECLKYTGTISNAKMPAVFEILEIGSGIMTRGDMDRLKLYATNNLFEKARIRAWLLDSQTATAWSSTRLAVLAKRRFERLMRMPDLSPGKTSPGPELSPAHRPGVPLFGAVLAFILVAIFVAELVVS